MKSQINKLFILAFIILTSGLLQAKTINLHWDWGVEKVNNADYFTVNLSPVLNLKNLEIQLEFPLEIRSNWTALKYDWDGWEDVIKKIEHIKYHLKFLNLYLGSIHNFNSYNNTIIFQYSDRLFTKFLKKRGLTASLNLNPFYAKILIPDLIDVDVFTLDTLYKTAGLSIGTTLFYDNDPIINYQDKPKDASTNKRVYTALNTGYTFKFHKAVISIESSLIKDLSPDSLAQNFTISIGPAIKFYDINFFTKILYYNHTEKLSIPVNFFYEIEREYINRNLSGLGCLLEFDYNINHILELSANIENSKSGKAYTYLGVSTDKNFFTAFKTSLGIYNRDVKKWYQLFQDRDSDTYLKIKFLLPLSENLSFTISYLKSFLYEKSISPLRYVILKTEFKF